ncbi:hypothetical protein LIA77_07409 [Sarocladium implicatum]|nr:hypothetical protein LIA77_07409 [Sarocladium implicatum]
MHASEGLLLSSAINPDPSNRSSSHEATGSRHYHAVYLIKTQVGLRDPDIPGPRFHHIIFVETNPHNRSGIVFNVVGDITSNAGMTYESRHDNDPQQSEMFHSKDLLGYTVADGFRDSWDALLGSLPTPPKQKEYNLTTNKTELVKEWEPLTFYAPGEAQHIPWKCTEWTNDHAIPALRRAGLILEVESVHESQDSYSCRVGDVEHNRDCQ